MNRFSVVSYGYSASRWLAFALSTHSDVFVAHGTYEIDSVIEGCFEAERTRGISGERLDPLTRGRTNLELKKLSLSELYAIYERSFPSKAVFGNVHTFVPRELYYKEDFNAISPKVFHLVRNPFQFIKSHMSGVIQAEAVPELSTHYSTFFELFCSRFPHVLELEWFDKHSIEQKAFFTSCYTLFNLAQDLRRYGPLMRTIQMEKMTTDIMYAIQTCEDITGLKYSTEDMRPLIDSGAINQHKSTSSHLDHSFESWHDWQKEGFTSVMSKELYVFLKTLGYALPDLTFQYDYFD
ncbi:hypothetical protein [Marinomonas balearica]|uniref:Sulfotransferase domain-containing protein n=1 Tax=Marinomonas balearica TaxID=491947 RepID=A0A4R6M601_9GAMM|nr:hypothetical protein [Marinomonas balearica]TDO96245.1 hypothetical protein DFP79_2817 [Marinomonas balearica]